MYEEGDDRLSQALAWEIKAIQEQNSLHYPSIAMVDHGTPIIAVNMVREKVGKDLKKIINTSAQIFRPAQWRGEKVSNMILMSHFWKQY